MTNVQVPASLRGRVDAHVIQVDNVVQVIDEIHETYAKPDHPFLIRIGRITDPDSGYGKYDAAYVSLESLTSLRDGLTEMIESFKETAEA